MSLVGSVSYRPWGWILGAVGLTGLVVGVVWDAMRSPPVPRAGVVAAIILALTALCVVVLLRIRSARVVLSESGVLVPTIRGSRMIPWSTVRSVTVVEYQSRGGDGTRVFGPALELHDGSVVKLPGVPAVGSNAPVVVGTAVLRHRARILGALKAHARASGVVVAPLVRPDGPSRSPSWQTDPDDPTQLRWWDGQAWGTEVRPAERPSDSVAQAFSGSPRRFTQLAVDLAVGCVAVIGVLVAGLYGLGYLELGPEGGDVETAAACDPGGGRNQCLYAARPDRRDVDHEAEIGSCVQISAGRACVLEASWKRDPILAELDRLTADLEGSATDGNGDDLELHAPDRLLVVAVRVRSSPRPGAGPFDWSVLTPDGRTVESTLYLGGDALPYASEPGELVEGEVAFDVGSGPGRYYIIYQPGLLGDRGIWAVDQPG